MDYQEQIYSRLKEEWELVPQAIVSKDDILLQLEARISSLLIRQPEQFFQLMYRLDISEQRLHATLYDPEQGIRSIASLIYERQLQKILSRENTRSSASDDPELSW